MIKGTSEYKSLHQWVRYNSIIPNACGDCGKIGKVDAANISQEYKRDLSDWEFICRSCHMNKDGRLKQLQKDHARVFQKTYCIDGHPAVTKTGLCMQMYNQLRPERIKC